MQLFGKIKDSGLLSKSGSNEQYGLINRLRNLLIDLSKEALRDMNIGHNQRAKELLKVITVSYTHLTLPTIVGV